VPIKVYSYSLNPDKVEEIRESLKSPPIDVFQKIEHYVMDDTPTAPLNYVQQIAKIYKVRGYDVKTRHVIVGASGKKHFVSIYARKHDGKATLIGFLIEPENAVDVIDKYHSAAVDVGAARTVLVAVTTLDSSTISYARDKGLTIVHGLDINEVVEKLEILLDIEDLVNKV